mmetsp:Transcript_26656/g.58022  ORF Transcript_26656/g.58022 Transcript_26656/m.58022 type:complete len:238 (-) Transcript_26656:191-904(-)
MTFVASERPVCSIANGANSWKVRKAIIPPTAASIPSTIYSFKSTGKISPTTITAAGSANPERIVSFKACHRLRVAKKTGNATAIPSGMLCNAIATASDSPNEPPFTEARNTAIPSGKLCNAIPIAVIIPLAITFCVAALCEFCRPPTAGSTFLGSSLIIRDRGMFKRSPTFGDLASSIFEYPNMACGDGSGTRRTTNAKNMAPAKKHTFATGKPIAVTACGIKSRKEIDSISPAARP